MKPCSFEGCVKRAICKGLCAGHYWQVRRGEQLRPLQVQYHGLSETARFMKRVDMRDKKECWNWTGKLSVSGYGRFGKGGETPELAHRASYRLFVGPIPEGMFVCHKCDNPACVNPDHLFTGTHTDNMRDMWAKNRARPGRQVGEKHGGAKLTEAAVKDIRSSPESGQAMVKKYGVSHTTITEIRHRQTWTHI